MKIFIPSSVSFSVLFFVLSLPIYAQETDQAQDNSQGNTQGIDDASNLEEMVVLGNRATSLSEITEDTQKLVETAGSMGDPLFAVFSLPGIVASGGDGGEPAVRGSSPSDNTYIVDFMPTSYIFHDFGVSIFSDYTLQDFQLNSAGFGAEYMSAMGAAFDIRLRDPKNEELNGIFDFSMLRSGLFIETGLTENSAIYASYRKSLLHYIIDEDDVSDEEEGFIIKDMPRDTDYQVKYVWAISDNHKLSINSNGATDSAAAEFTEISSFTGNNPDFAGDASLDKVYKGNNIVWEFNQGRYQSALGLGKLIDEYKYRWGDNFFANIGFDQTTVKGMYQFPLTKTHTIATGFQNSQLDFRYVADQILFVCTEFDATCDLNRGERIQLDSGINYTERSLYLKDIWQPSMNFTLKSEVQWYKNTYNDETFIHPRFSAMIDLSQSWIFETKLGSYNQMHDIDILLPETGSPNIKSPTSKHLAFALHNQLSNGWSWSIEPYYKTFKNLPLSSVEDITEQDLRYIASTEGKAYGLDFLLNKNKIDKWHSWLAISLAKSERTNLVTNETKEYMLDTPIIINWVYNYQWTEKLNIGWRWTIRSGTAYTPITGTIQNPFFEDEEVVMAEYGDSFSDRLPVYNRIDVRIKYDTKMFGKEGAFIVDILNATNHGNVTERSLDRSKVKTLEDNVVVKDEESMGFQPTMTYRMKF